VDYDGFDDGYGDPSDYGMTQSDFDTATSIGQAVGSGNEDSIAQAIANSIAQPQVGQNRSNVIGTSNYDPQYAAALQISRGLNPGVNTGGLDVPSYLQPQLTGPVASDFKGSFNLEPKYYSPVERFMQTTLSDIAQSGPGIVGLVGRGLDSLFGGIDFLNNSKAGSTVEEEVVKEEQKQNQMTDPNFNPISNTTIGIEDLDPAFMDVDRTKSKDAGASLAVDPNLSPDFVSRMRSIDALPAYSAVPQPVMVNQIQRDIAKSRGIFDLPQAADLQNNQIAAGSSTGQTLSSGPMSGGYTLSPITSTGSVREKTVQGPEKAPEKAPPGYVDIVMSEDISPRFAGTNMSIYGGKGPGESFKPKSELEAQAAIDAGFSLAPFTPMFEKTFNPRDYTKDLTPLGVNLPAAEFRFNRQPEVATRFKISDLPREVQEIVGLRSNLDYDRSFPLQTILDSRRSVDKGEFSQKEMGDFLAGFSR
jgi:hypothetical protein|tara:strand:+ start:405 stop:1829 length:1425 start_codon:yes stop_codon:yes gene_type:complete